MTVDQGFIVCNVVALAGWALLVLAPSWGWTERLVLSGFWSLLLAIVYLVLAILYLPGAEGGFGSLAEVMTLFRQPGVALVGWVHYLAFDLLVGALEVRQAKELRIPHPIVIPALVLTFLFGPIGLLVFFAIKSFRQRRLAEVTA